MDSGLDISLDQWMILGPVWQLESASQKELGEICLKDKTSITRIIDALEKKNLVGVTNGLAWTEVGGEILSIEVILSLGKGRITITGKLGEVMS